jgi:hypothetical protein
LTGGIDQKHPRGHAKIKGIFEGRKFASVFMNKMPFFSGGTSSKTLTYGPLSFCWRNSVLSAGPKKYQ